MEAHMKRIRDILQEHPELYVVQQHVTVEEAARFMAEKNIGALPVLEGNRLVGIVSERDVITRVVAQSKDPAKPPVREVMSTDLLVASPDEPYESCLRKMKQANIRHLPVIEEDKLVGVISLRDLLRVDLDEKDEQIEFLHRYLFTVPPGVAKQYGEQGVTPEKS